jgi:DNA-binding MarR family transcriptional regulator
MSKTARPDSEPDPVDYIASIFRVRQRMLPPLRQIALADCGVPLEQADILVELHGVRELGWPEPEADPDGYVTYRALRDALVHGDTLLSRRISRLEEAGLVETRKASRRKGVRTPGLHGNALVVRITASGSRKIEPVWLRYRELVNRLLAGVSAAELRAGMALNQLIESRLKSSWLTLPDELR